MGVEDMALSLESAEVTRISKGMADTTPTPPEVDPDTPKESEADRRAKLPEVARRALEEADARKAAQAAADMPTELGGRDGPEPVRYGDWEKKGIAIDF
jgi:hypothetical protein